jgi:hypothetical protein
MFMVLPTEYCHIEEVSGHVNDPLLSGEPSGSSGSRSYGSNVLSVFWLHVPEKTQHQTIKIPSVGVPAGYGIVLLVRLLVQALLDK